MTFLQQPAKNGNPSGKTILKMFYFRVLQLNFRSLKTGAACPWTRCFIAGVPLRFVSLNHKMWQGRKIQSNKKQKQQENYDQKIIQSSLAGRSRIGGVTAAQAQDALLGFNDAGGTGNDYVIDLGAGSQFTPTATLNLSPLFSASSFNTAFTATPNTNVAAGFVSQVGSTGFLQSYAGGTPAGTLPSGTPSAPQWDAAFAAASGILLGVYSSASGSTPGGSAWSYNIAASPTANGLAAGNALSAQTGNPMGTLGSGVIDLTVYESTDPNLGNRGEIHNCLAGHRHVGDRCKAARLTSLVFRRFRNPPP